MQFHNKMKALVMIKAFGLVYSLQLLSERSQIRWPGVKLKCEMYNKSFLPQWLQCKMQHKRRTCNY